jgi:nucleotide-binding universal stress UspA family protein
MYERILVPIDGSETARAGFKEALALAGDQKATLRLLHIVSDFPIMLEMSSVMDFEKYRQGLCLYGEDLLKDAKAQAASRGSSSRRSCVTSRAAAWPTRSSRKPRRPIAT